MSSEVSKNYSFSSNRISNLMNSLREEDDSYSHQYEELPVKPEPPEKPDLPSRMPVFSITPPSAAIERKISSASSMTSSFSAINRESAVILRKHEGREHMYPGPCYEKMTLQLPTVSSKVMTPAPKEKLERKRNLVMVMFTLMLLFSCCALSLSIYVFVVVLDRIETMPHSSTTVELRDSLFELKQKVASATGVFNSLSNKITGLEQKVPTEVDHLRDEYYATQLHLGNTMRAINSARTDLLSHLHEFEEHAEEKIDAVRKQPGPVGPAGPAYLSNCYYKNYTRSVRADVHGVEEDKHPSDEVLDNNIVMFASCSVLGGTWHMLHPVFITERRLQYHCDCGGQDMLLVRHCTLHLWLCPRQ